MVVIKFKNNKKRCVFCVVPGNGQVLLRMLDIAALKLFNINIDSIQVGMAEHKTNIEQEMHMVEEGCTNTDADSKTKQGANSQNSHNNTNKPINYFFSSSNIDADKGKSSELTRKYTTHLGMFLMALGVSKAHSLCRKYTAHLGMFFNGIGCFKGTFSLQLKPNSKPYQVTPRHVVYVLKKCSRKNWITCRGWTSSPL